MELQKELDAIDNKLAAIKADGLAAGSLTADETKSVDTLLERRGVVEAELEQKAAETEATKTETSTVEADEVRAAVSKQGATTLSLDSFTTKRAVTTDVEGVTCNTLADQITKDLTSDCDFLRLNPRIVRGRNGSPYEFKLRTIKDRGISWVEEKGQIPKKDIDAPETVIIGTHKAACIIEASNEAISDACFDLTGYIAEEFVRDVDYGSALAWFSGDGNGKPDGLLPNSTPGGSVDPSAVTKADLRALFLANRWRGQASWIMNPATWVAVEDALQADGNCCSNYRDGSGSLLFGRPVVLDDHLPAPDVAAAGDPVIAFADVNSAYLARIIDSIRVESSNSAGGAWDTDCTSFRVVARFGGGVICPEATHILTAA